MTESTAAAPRSQLMSLLTAKWLPPIVGVLAELNIADQLVDGPRSAESLAKSLDAHPRALYRLLRAAASVGVFTEDDGRFGLNPMGECLRTDAPDSLRSAAMMFSLEPFWSPYAQIRHSALTGEPAFDRVYGTSIYQYLSEHSEQVALFSAAAAGFHAQAIADIAGGHDFSRYGTVVDVGGGTGSLLAAILQRHPTVRGVLFDLPDVIEQARPAERIELVAGDFFDIVPGGDALLIKSCLHNFADDQAIEILRVIRRAMSDQDVLLVAETVVPVDDSPHYAKLDDIEMLVIAGGADRDEREYANLLAAAGFAVERMSPCGDRFSLIEARPT